VDRTLVLETTFTTATGLLVLTDLLALGPENRGHRLGRYVPRHQLTMATILTSLARYRTNTPLTHATLG
jgi:hypothetical protein